MDFIAQKPCRVAQFIWGISRRKGLTSAAAWCEARTVFSEVGGGNVEEIARVRSFSSASFSGSRIARFRELLTAYAGKRFG